MQRIQKVSTFYEKTIDKHNRVCYNEATEKERRNRSSHQMERNESRVLITLYRTHRDPKERMMRYEDDCTKAPARSCQRITLQETVQWVKYAEVPLTE